MMVKDFISEVKHILNDVDYDELEINMMEVINLSEYIVEILKEHYEKFNSEEQKDILLYLRRLNGKQTNNTVKNFIGNVILRLQIQSSIQYNKTQKLNLKRFYEY